MKVGSGNVGINVQFLTVFVATLPNLHRYLPQRVHFHPIYSFRNDPGGYEAVHMFVKGL